MKKKICEFFAANPQSSIKKCANYISENELEVMHCVRELVREGYLNPTIISSLNDVELGNSHFYSLRKKYVEVCGDIE